ncbi:MAG: bifunctional diaminohydroxyphosphoribosylaminopyrimidine deaminase/5-amino-6-(5-phosphoribosylamino)uracil reductase RibD [Steroidobacteraceae bacterium]|nr:bifunctional diaminohydroxyphosphoribosylaminopyrimidine deaminase/5-amino-6-(5-phosphoribosylamino)uracil reductase RibD [Steroidobacteraceae bacterium]
MSFDAVDARHMARALRLAEKGLATADPNPRVGCVIADGERVLGEGFHGRAGGPHAEIEALRDAGGPVRGATAYVTLEPCSHHGRTPPCADALVEAGLRRVVFAIGDPNPRVNGDGASRLAAAGVVVESGLMAAEARALNPGFFSRMQRGRPFVRLKLAASLDGRTAPGSGASRWITGEAARADVQRLRARSGAILTGIATVLADDPRLDVRLPGATRQPLRVILDRRLALPATARLLDPPGELLVFTTAQGASRAGALAARGARVEALPEAGRGLDLAAALTRLAALEVNELMVEAGPTLAGALLEADLVDEFVLYLAPVLLGPDARPLALLPPLADMRDRRGFDIVDSRRVGADLRLTLAPRNASS